MYRCRSILECLKTKCQSPGASPIELQAAMPNCPEQLLDDVVSLCICLRVLAVRGEAELPMYVWRGQSAVAAAIQDILKDVLRQATQRNGGHKDKPPRRSGSSRPELRSIVAGRRLSDRPIIMVCHQFLLIMAAHEACGETEPFDVADLTEQLAHLMPGDKDSVRTWLRVVVDTFECFGAVDGPSKLAAASSSAKRSHDEMLKPTAPRDDSASARLTRAPIAAVGLPNVGLAGLPAPSPLPPPHALRQLQMGASTWFASWYRGPESCMEVLRRCLHGLGDVLKHHPPRVRQQLEQLQLACHAAAATAGPAQTPLRAAGEALLALNQRTRGPVGEGRLGRSGGLQAQRDLEVWEPEWTRLVRRAPTLPPWRSTGPPRPSGPLS